MLPAIAAFALGAAVGALGWRHTGFLALLAPVSALVLLAARSGADASDGAATTTRA